MACVKTEHHIAQYPGVDLQDLHSISWNSLIDLAVVDSANWKLC
jgi:hypothetical protein